MHFPIFFLNMLFFHLPLFAHNLFRMKSFYVAVSKEWRTSSASANIAISTSIQEE